MRKQPTQSEAAYNPDGLRERANHYLALLGVLAAAGGTLASPSTAHSAESPSKNSTPAGLSAEKGTIPIRKSSVEAIKDCIDRANHDKSANVWYGAILVDRKGNYDTYKNPTYASPDKNRRQRLNKVVDQYLLIDPVRVVCDGTVFYTGFDRGPSDNIDYNASDASASGDNLLAHVFLDIKQAERNGTSLTYFAHRTAPPKMVHSSVTAGKRNLSPADGAPQITPVGMYVRGAGGSDTSIQTYIKNVGLNPTPLHNYHLR
jgi:hypothetical protein